MHNKTLRIGIFVALLAALSMLPFLGITDFYTKG